MYHYVPYYIWQRHITCRYRKYVGKYISISTPIGNGISTYYLYLFPGTSQYILYICFLIYIRLRLHHQPIVVLASLRDILIRNWTCSKFSCLFHRPIKDCGHVNILWWELICTVIFWLFVYHCMSLYGNTLVNDYWTVKEQSQWNPKCNICDKKCCDEVQSKIIWTCHK